MIIWNGSAEKMGAEGENRISSRSVVSGPYNPTYSYAVIDTEIGLDDHSVHDIGALRHDGAVFHKVSKSELIDFLKDIRYLCGHNIIHHDIKYLFGSEPCP